MLLPPWNPPNDLTLAKNNTVLCTPSEYAEQPGYPPSLHRALLVF